MRKYLFLILVMLAGCLPGGSFLEPVSTKAPTLPATQPGPPAITQTVTPAATDTPLPYEACGWQWATQELPEISQQITQAYQAAGMPEVTARAAAYGENCLGQDGKVKRFAAMQTDLYLTAQVKDLQDTAALGDLAAKILPVLDPFTPDRLSGPNPGRITIRFQADSGEVNLGVARTKTQELLQKGLSGQALFDALRQP